VLDPRSLLFLLLGTAVGAAGLLQGFSLRATVPAGTLAEMETRLRMAQEENEMLKRENESLRSLAQGGGEIAVPQELIDRAEKEFGLRFLSSPVIHRIAREELRDRIAAAIESRFGPSGIDDRQDAYQLIGWLDEGDDLLAQLTAVRSVGARGWFDEVTGEGWVSDQFRIEDIPDQAAMVRLLARILLHQHYPPPPSYPGDDAARAREALHQGAASGSEARFMAANARSIGFMPMKRNPEAEQLLATLSTFITGLATFPVIEGKGLADTLHVQGNESLQEKLRNPPQTTRQIIYPAEATSEATMLELPKFPEEPYLIESAGQLGLLLWIQTLGDAGEASAISAEWKRDRYALIPDGEASTAVLWEIELETADAATRLAGFFQAFIAAKAGLTEEKPLDDFVRTPQGRYLKVSLTKENRVRFINAAEEATVNRW